jgi:hypothetical protein
LDAAGIASITAKYAGIPPALRFLDEKRFAFYGN